MGLSNAVRAALQDAYFGDGGLTVPASIYVGLHAATPLSAGLSGGESSVSVVDDPAGTTKITIDPGGANEETHDVASISGAGPYTINLDGTTVQNAHSSGEFVRTHPAADGSNVREPSSGAYARVEQVNSGAGQEWNAATSADPSVKDNSAAVTMPESTGAWLDGDELTDAVLFDALSGGAYQGNVPLDTVRKVEAAGVTLEFAAGELNIELGNQ